MAKHILLFEPQTEGHHLSWLCMLAEDFLAAGYKVTLAIDLRSPKGKAVIERDAPGLIENVALINTFDDRGCWKGGSKIKSVAQCLIEVGADEVFCNSLDEFGSDMLRRACFGIYPPAVLKGKISGIWHRPKHLDASFTGFTHAIKKRGFWKLQLNGWLKEIFILDELLKDQVRGFRNVHLLVDPWSTNYKIDKTYARQRLGIESDKIVILNYGTASKRKGVPLLLDAFEKARGRSKLFLLVAGRVGSDKDCVKALDALKHRGEALVLNYYVSSEEEQLCFAACDYVVMPYLSHYGSSGILSRATAAGKPVIVSDFHLLGYLVKTYKLGYVFKNKDASSLMKVLESIGEANIFKDALDEYSLKCSRAAFRKRLYAVYSALNKI
jgi:glycosyltransferase involved in cell wall biosynthesis